LIALLVGSISYPEILERGVDFMVNAVIMRLIIVINTEVGQGQLMHWGARLPFRWTSSGCRSGTTGTLGIDNPSLSPGIQ